METAAIDEGRASAREDHRAVARETWSAGNWDEFSKIVTAVGALVLERAEITPGMRVLDVGTGSGGNVAIPAAQLGASVVGLDVTPELFVPAQRRAAEANVDVEWVEGDAQELPFETGAFERVISTFGAMFAPDHARAAAELVRVCARPGRVLMTTWLADGFAGELFKLSSAFMPPPPGAETPALWGEARHIEARFAAAGASPLLEHESIETVFPSVEAAVDALRSRLRALRPRPPRARAAGPLG